jgi:putative glutamine amidotransferase
MIPRKGVLGSSAVTAPLIGVTTSITVDEYPERAYVNSAYVRAIEGAGGIPVLLPPQLGAAAREALWPRLDALILTGGGDIEPSRFGESPHRKVMLVSDDRDALELELVDRALRDDVPLFGICRGVQVLNVALGGSLHQHIPDTFGDTVQHAQKEPRHVATHPVKVLTEGTRLGQILGVPELTVNSFHHQALRMLGRGLRDVAWAPDDVIEAVEHEDDRRFVVGVQWHPEDLVEHDAAAQALFRAVVAAARARGRS